MVQSDLMDSFLTSIQSDARIGPNHISLFAGIAKLAKEQGDSNMIHIFSRELMPLSKLNGRTTYHRTIRDLHEFGYIRYTPSFNHFLGSLVILNL